MNDVPESSLANTLQALSRVLPVLGPTTPLPLEIPHDPGLDELIFSLPRLTEADLGSELDGVCPICLVQFRAHLAEEEMALAMDSPAHTEQDLGVTRLENTCGHIFCRKDISTWIRQSRNSCPTCRRRLLDTSPEERPLFQDYANGNPVEGGGEGNVSEENRQDIAAQVADDVVREMLEALGPLDVAASSDQADAMRRLVETLLPGTFEIQMPSATEDYPERDEFEMYS